MGEDDEGGGGEEPDRGGEGLRRRRRGGRGLRKDNRSKRSKLRMVIDIPIYPRQIICDANNDGAITQEITQNNTKDRST